MLVPLSWLRTFTPADRSAAQLSDAFNELGLVVEGVEVTGEGLDGVVTALVRGIRKHPNADRMRLIDIVLSEDQVEPLQVACGAFNFVEGDRVPLAQVGAVLPGNFKIERAKKRGEWSNGMLCSARELRLSDDHEGILVLSPDTPLNVPIAEALGMMRDLINEPFATAHTTGNSRSAATPLTCCAFKAKSSPKTPAVFLAAICVITDTSSSMLAMSSNNANKLPVAIIFLS